MATWTWPRGCVGIWHRYVYLFSRIKVTTAVYRMECKLYNLKVQNRPRAGLPARKKKKEPSQGSCEPLREWASAEVSALTRETGPTRQAIGQMQMFVYKHRG